jgi:hypothetical protein
MNQPALRLTRPGQLPAPATGDDRLQVLTDAIDNLARLRTPYWLGDSAVHLHALNAGSVAWVLDQMAGTLRTLPGVPELLIGADNAQMARHSPPRSERRDGGRAGGSLSAERRLGAADGRTKRPCWRMQIIHL